MIKLDNGLERKKIVHFSLLKDVGVLQGELKIKGLINWECDVTLEWLIWHECVSYVGAQDDPWTLLDSFKAILDHQGKEGHCDLHKSTFN